MNKPTVHKTLAVLCGVSIIALALFAWPLAVFPFVGSAYFLERYYQTSGKEKPWYLTDVRELRKPDE